MTTTLSLTGKHNINTLNLTGKSTYCKGDVSPYYVIRLKKYIFDTFITPIMSKKWKILKQNSFNISNTIKKLQNYYILTHDDTLILYENMLYIIKTTIDTTDELETLENNLFNTNGNNIAQLMYKIPRVRLSPPFELYNLIIGKPEKFAYDKNILDYITNLIKKEYITFNEIEENVKKYFNI